MPLIRLGLGLLLLIIAPPKRAPPPPPEHPGVLLSIFQGHTDQIRCIAVGSGRIVASGGADKTVRLWDTATGKEKHVLAHEGVVNCLAFSADGKKLATGDARSLVQLWDVETGKKQRSFDGRFALSADGKTLALARADGSIQLLHLTENKPSTRLESHKEPAFAMAFAPDGKTFASAALAGGRNDNGHDKSIKLWDVESGKLLATMVGHARGVYCLTFAPDGKTLMAADFNGSMKLWDLRTAAVDATLEKVQRGTQLTGTPEGFWAIAPDLKTWAVGAGRDVHWLDIAAFSSAAK